MELIFESRRNLSNYTGSLHFVQWRPEVHQEPVIRPDTFVDAKGVSSYGTVLNENGKLKMWYQVMPEDWPGNVDVASVAYAESEDGYHWKKAPLGIVEHGPGDNHLCDLALHSPSIFYDPSAPPSHRYRATGCGRPGFLARPNLTHGFYSAHSADGLHWELDADEPLWVAGDVITNTYHPGRQAGIVALKTAPWVHRMRRRCIHTAQFKNGQYSDHVSALYPDEYDDIVAMRHGHVSADYYGMAMQPAGQGTVGFIWNFWHDLPYWKGVPYGAHGHSAITLAFQEREGDRWLHAPGRPSFISHHDLPWTQHGWIYSSSAPVEIGDEHRLYFSGVNFEHYRFRDPEGQPVEHWERWIEEYGVGGITFARWPKYRLFGFDTPREASFTIELSDVEQPFELCLNYHARRGGRVFASIDGEERYSVANSVALCGDEITSPVVWKHGSVITPPENGKVAVTLTLEMAAVYAYEVVPLYMA